jgi:hypothetical protein
VSYCGGDDPRRLHVFRILVSLRCKSPKYILAPNLFSQDDPS